MCTCAVTLSLSFSFSSSFLSLSLSLSLPSLPPSFILPLFVVGMVYLHYPTHRITLTQEAESGSDDLCSELYHGPSPGSELEVKAISGFLESLGPIIGVIDFHSYHQEILYPPGIYVYAGILHDLCLFLCAFFDGMHYHCEAIHCSPQLNNHRL